MKKNLGWKIYFILFCVMAWGNLVSLFAADSPPYIFYHIFIAFHTLAHVNYFLNIGSAVLTLLSAMPMFLCILEASWLPLDFWKFFILLRLTFDLLGRSYEFIFFKSLWIDDYRYGLAYLFSLSALLFPSYWLIFRYAFHSPKTPQK